jgi:hypothetical protein
MLYPMIVARKEVLVQLEDGLVAELDRLAKELGVSRSEILRRGAAAILEAADIARADRDLAEAYRRQPQDPLFTEALARLAAAAVPEW